MTDKAVIKAAFLFIPLFLLLMIAYVYMKRMIGLESMFLSHLVIPGVCAYIVLRSIVERTGLLPNTKQKILFLSITFGFLCVYIVIAMISKGYLYDGKASIGLFGVSIDLFFMFCGIWPTISTIAERVFKKEIGHYNQSLQPNAEAPAE